MSKFLVQYVFFVKYLQLLRAASKAGRTKLLGIVKFDCRRFEKQGGCLMMHF